MQVVENYKVIFSEGLYFWLKAYLLWAKIAL